LRELTNYTILIYAGNSGGFETTGNTTNFQTPVSRIFFFISFFSPFFLQKLTIDFFSQKKSPNKS